MQALYPGKQQRQADVWSLLAISRANVKNMEFNERSFLKN